MWGIIENMLSAVSGKIQSCKSQVGDTQSIPVPYSVHPACLSPAIAQKYRWLVQIAIREPNKEDSLLLS
jgi:hypothetical protein